MRDGWTGLTATLAALVLLGALAPSASAHAAPEPLEIEEHVLADEGEDTFYWYDGYDLYHLHTREAYWPPAGQEGVIFRFTLYGGFSETSTVDELHVEIAAEGPDGESVHRITTTDDREWTGDMHIVAANITQDEPPFTGVTSRMQTFVSYADLGAAPGDAISNVTMRSYAGEDLVDVAPGGVYPPGSGGNGEVPTESERVTDDLPLTGPDAYTDHTVAASGNMLGVTVENSLENGQHVGLQPQETPGWDVRVSGGAAASLDGGDTVTFQLEVLPSPNATEPLPIAVVSDLGGREWIHVGVNGTELQTASTSDQVEVQPRQPTNDSPGPGAASLLGLVALGALALRRRR